MNLSTYFLSLPSDAALAHDVGVDLDRQFFLEAMRNAQFARGTTHPNPSVGAVLVKDDRVIAHGFTEPPGGMHAEKKAIANCAMSTSGAMLYVTLEPCCHFGRTPPCTRAIIDAGITRVVYGVKDPNPVVAGQGCAELINAGIDVEIISAPDLQAMSHALLLPFTKWIKEKKPYVVVKIATSADGCFAKTKGERTKITGDSADLLVHKMRRAADGIMVGGQTARTDDPQLLVRLDDGGHGHQPVAIIASTSGDLDADLHIMQRDNARAIVAVPHGCGARVREKSASVLVIEVNSDEHGLDLNALFAELGRMGFTLIMVEAGPRLFSQLVNLKIADEIFWFRSQKIFGSDGYGLENVSSLLGKNYRELSSEKLGDDDLRIFAR